MADLSDLKSKAITGSIWSLLEQFSMLFVQFVVGIILARLLSPNDYGLLALTMVFSGVSAAITDGGFEKSLIHKKDLTSVQINTIFYINIFLGLAMVVVVILVAPYISVFFSAPKLTSVLRIVALGIFINAAGQTPSALLRKELQFKKISYSHMVGSLTGGIVGIILAYKGFGVWALVMSTLSAQIVMLLGYLYCSTWRPKLEFSYQSIKSMLPFGLNILFSSIVFFAIAQFNNLVVGKYYNKADLGLFHRGSRFPELITSVVEGVVLKMAFPVFSKVQDDKQQLVMVLKKTVKILAFITFPLITLLFVNARDLTLVLFTKKWEGSVIFLEFFCLVKLFYPLVIVYKEVLLVKGYAKLSTRILTIFSIVEITLVLAMVQFGIKYVVLCTLFIAICQYITYLTFFSQKVGLSVWTQINWLSKYFLDSIIIIAVTLLAEKLLSNFEMLLTVKVIIKLFVGMVAYVLFAFVLNIEEVSYIKNSVNFFKLKFS
ncbi:Membrane protein involved in the export of O-antigen and teichoic acid [Mucilaginibacter pineti]|uniref:Membrane protein involved in the export of O-antigen and teichoic acid n=1 Tax=Mucilaginibacter pineti TaxID=1391627 RepID=A0A1G6ZDV4_9SPHI|nr:lipopolysaccharide biosynthesis protein [Mucilaginibacter pineti]SDE00788.1 Membrane protein involved in the export of O-antigen and teichoic acid [Mucilaginibacter pineti]